jgi:hypothetical protein
MIEPRVRKQKEKSSRSEPRGAPISGGKVTRILRGNREGTDRILNPNGHVIQGAMVRKY